MRQNNLSMWKYDSSLNCLLFFVQRMDELLFHHSTDTYRYSALSIRGLAGEYCSVYKDIQNGVLNKKNLSHIIDELVDRLINLFSLNILQITNLEIMIWNILLDF